MNPVLSQKEIEEITTEVKASVLSEVKRMAVNRVLSENKDRIEHHLAVVASDLSRTIAKEFPL